jgi:hypothetical protein
MTLVAAGLAALAVLLARAAPPLARTPARGLRRAAPGLGAAVVLAQPGTWLVLLTILAATGVAGRMLWQRRAEARLAARTTASVVEVCDLLAAELAAGRPPGAALDEAATAWPGLRPVADACRLGADVPAALRLVALTPGADGLRLLAGAWSVSQRTGGGLASATRRVAETVRAEQSTRRLVVGEVRGAEVVELLAALNTGHEGGCGTIHANSAGDVPARVEALALAAGLARDAAHSQFLAGVDAVLHLGRNHDGGRVLREVAVPVRRTDGTAEVRTAVAFRGDGASVTGPGEAQLVERLCR